jgi:hypothetical protein
MRKTTIFIVLICVLATFATNLVPATGMGAGTMATGGRLSNMTVVLTGPLTAQSGATVALDVHVTKEIGGDLQGANVTFKSGGAGFFDLSIVMTDSGGLAPNIYHAPVNMGTQVLTVTITATGNLTGYKNGSMSMDMDVYPMTRGEPMRVNQSITHLAYVTTFWENPGYWDPSSIHSGIDLKGTEQVKIGGPTVTVLNFTTWEMGDWTFVSQGKFHHIITDAHGYYYFENDMHGTVYMYMNGTTRENVYTSGPPGTWTNITKVSILRYLPAMRGFNMTLDKMGNTQEFVNTYMMTETIRDLDTGATTTTSELKTDVGDYLYEQYEVLQTFMGWLPVKVFMDGTGTVHDYYSMELGALVQEIVYNETGHQVSTMTLIEYNAQIGEDPSDPSFSVTVLLDVQSIVAGASTIVHVNVGGNLKGVAVTATVGAGGKLNSTTGVTGSDGSLDLEFTADTGISTTNVVISVSASLSGYRSSSASTTITVLKDITLPLISHKPFTAWEEGVPLKIEALVSDDAGIATATLYYRTGVPGVYKTIAMTSTNGVFMATIPGTAMLAPLVEYYLEATDINGNLIASPMVAPDDGQYDVYVSHQMKAVGPLTATLGQNSVVTVNAAVRGDLTLNITKVNSPDKGPTDARFLGIFAEVRAIGSGQLIWANISFSYNDAMLGTLSAAELRTYWWDTQGSTWMTIDDTGVVPGSKLVWANVTHLTVFAPRAQTMPVVPPPVDTTMPTVSVIAPANNAVLDEGAVHISGLATDDTGLYSVQVNIDNGVWTDVAVLFGSKAAQWSYDQTLKPGDHYIHVRAKDKAGNVGNIVSISVKVNEVKVTQGSNTQMLMTVAIALIIVIVVVAAIYLASKSPAKKEGEEILDEEEAEKGPKGKEEE